MKALFLIIFALLSHLAESGPTRSTGTQLDGISIRDLLSSPNDRNSEIRVTISSLFRNAFFGLPVRVGMGYTSGAFGQAGVPLKDIDLGIGTNSTWSVKTSTPISGTKCSMALNCQRPTSEKSSTQHCQVSVNRIDVVFDSTFTSQWGGNDGLPITATLTQPMNISWQKIPTDIKPAVFYSDIQPTIHLKSGKGEETRTLSSDETTKLNPLIGKIRSALGTQTSTFITTNLTSTSDLLIKYPEIPDAAQITSNLYVIADPDKDKNTSKIIPPSRCITCIIENLKPGIGPIPDLTAAVVIQGISNFSDVELQAKFNFTTTTCESLRGKFVWDFGSRGNSNYSAGVDFTIESLYLRGQIIMGDSPKPETVSTGVDLEQLRLETSASDVVQNDDEFLQCLRSVVTTSVVGSLDEVFNAEARQRY